MLAVVGHNSAAFDQTLSELSDVLDRDKTPKRRFPYFKFYPRDWLEATRGMSLEERGAYIDFICLFMEAEGDLADDDNWIRHQMHVPKQRWRKMKSKLIEHGKISIQGDRLVNERCLRELDDLMAKSSQNSKNIQKRWEKVGEKSQQSSKKVETFPAEKSKKSNKINEDDDTNVSRHARVTTDSDTDLEKERKKELPTTEPSPRESGGGSYSGLNGSASMIVEKLAGWINPMMPDKRTAQGALDSLVKLYTAPVVRDGFAELEGKILHGDIIAKPIPYLTNACLRHSERKAKAKPAQKHRKPNPWD